MTSINQEQDTIKQYNQNMEEFQEIKTKIAE